MSIIIKPVISEKMTAITDKQPERCAFRVSPKANKIEIKNAVEKMYNVKVVDVNTIKTQDSLYQRWYYQRSCSCLQKGNCNS